MIATFDIPLPPSHRWKGQALSDIPLMNVIRFLEKFDEGREYECWLWNAYCDAHGYGRVRIGGKLRLAHRVAYAMEYGSVPEGMDVLHKCDNPGCVNPFHLRLGTHADNMADKKHKGRAPKAQGPNHPKSKLTWAIVGAIRGSTERGCDLAARYGVSENLISRIRHNKCWRVA